MDSGIHPRRLIGEGFFEAQISSLLTARPLPDHLPALEKIKQDPQPFRWGPVGGSGAS